MVWYELFSDTIKKKVCRYLLQRYLGQFLDQKLELDQLNIDITNGRVSVNNVKLYCEALNELCEVQEWGIEVKDGHIGSVTVNIPWNALMTEDSVIHVKNLYISLRPQIREKDGTSMLESMWSSMSSSMQLAQDCLEKEGIVPSIAQSNVMEGLERFAQTIDNVLNRVKARFIDTEIRLEYVPPDTDRGIALIIKIEKLEYQNEAGNDPPDKDNNTEDEQQQQQQNKEKSFLLSYATHHLIMEGITFFTEEFRIVSPDKDETPTTEKLISSQQFYSTTDLPESSQFFSNNNLRSESDEIEKDVDCDVYSTPEIYRSEQIIIGKMTNRLEMRLKMKQADNIPGPKVQLEITIGAFSAFLTPRQLHLLILLSDVLLFNNDVSNDTKKQLIKQTENQTQSPMDIDFRKNTIGRFNAMSGGLGLNQGWSSSGDNFENLSILSNLVSEVGGLSDSVISSSSSMTSSMSSSASQSTQRSNRKRFIDLTSNADISNINIRIACFSLVLLHEDVLFECSSPLAESPLSEQSVHKLKMLSEQFFSTVGVLSVGLGVNDMIKAGRILDNSCKCNNLRIILAPIIIEGEEQRNTNGNQLRLVITIARADIREVLNDISVPILQFNRDKSSVNSSSRPEMTINLNQLQRAIRSSTGRKFAPPKTEINVILGPCQTEFDISIIDRLSGIINPSPFNTSGSNINQTKRNINLNKKTEPKIEVNIELSAVELKLRFPIADLRPIHDPQRIPWWERNVRADYILLTVEQMRLNYFPPSKYDITANEINLFYCENDKSNPIPIGRAKYSEIPGTRFKSASTDYPKITIELPSTEILQQYKLQTHNECDSGPILSGDNLGLPRKTESTPFTSKKNCRESDTPHTKQTDDTETLIIPGDRKEMENFCQTALKTSKIQLIFNLPIVSLQLKSKHLYEVIYNRINSDLLLWEACAPRCNKRTATTPMATSLLNVGMMDSVYVPFAMCKSGINYESSSSTANSDSESDNDLFYSVSDKKAKRTIPPILKDTSNTIAFRLNIGQGMFTMYAPVRDSQNRVIPGQLGEFVIKVRSAYVFSVNGFEGDENLAYFCMQAKSAEMYHCGLIPVPVHDPPLRVIGCILPTHMQSTFYPMSKDLTLNDCKGSTEREMISLAIQIKVLPEQRRKRIRVAAGVQLITLRHYFALAQHTWLTQLTDMFDVIDYEVQGYTPYGVVTELHLHLWDCAIDYRPMYFNYRAIATIGTFMISSNITTACPGCTLRFVAEDSTLSLAPQIIPTKNKNKIENKITTLPPTDLVCILDLGLFEISLRLNEKATVTFPKFDLRASINDVHIRTCSDSGRALAQFISYLAAEGDFEEFDDNETNEADNMSIQSDGETELLPVKTATQNIPEVTPLQQERVNTLMADAMEESMRIVTTTHEETPIQDLGVEVFFFPDEKNMPSREQLQQQQARKCIKSESVSSLESLEKKSVIRSISSLDDGSYSPNYDKEDSDSINTELRDLLDFETSEMGLKSAMETEVLEALPQVTRDLGDINKLKTLPPVNDRNKSSDTDEDFCIIAEEERVGYSDKGMQEVPMSEDPIRIVDNHFSIPHGKPDLLQAPQGFPMAVMRYTLCEMSLVWHMYGGHDFLTDEEKQKRTNSKTPYKYSYHHQSMSEVYKTGVSYSKGSPNVQLGTVNRLTWKTRGGTERKHTVLMEVQINKVRFSHETYPIYTEQASRQVLLITELEIRDRLEVSNINKFLYHPSKTKHGTQHMVVMKALHLRPDSSLPAQECCLRISILPLRLNIDQDSLEFLVTFFMELGSAGSSDEPEIRQQSTPSHQPPVMMVEAAQELHARKMVSENLLLLMEEEEGKEKEATESVSDVNDSTPIYFRNIVFGPAVPIRLDYQGKHIEFNHGPLAGLIMGLGQLQCSQIKLKSISHRHGILGVDRLLNFLLQEWLQDIKRNQLQSILVGVGPMHSLVQLFQGIKDLFWLPIEQYQKDGRIVRGLQLGAQSFTARTALAALEITTRIIHLLQITAETAYDMVSPGPSSVRRGRGNRKGKKKRSQPPQDIREGVASAYQIMKDGFGETAHTIVEVACLEHDQKGYTGAVGAVVRQIPPTVVRPLVLATQATSKVLGGVRNQLVPDARVESRQKWKEDEEN